MRKIRRKCACGCGGITNYGKIYIHNHHWRDKKHTAETKEKLSEAAQNMSDEHKRKISEAKQNMSAETKEKISEARQGKKHSAETKLKMPKAKIKYDPNYPYCDIWKDEEYKKDIRKNYCENIDCKKICKRLGNHHIHLDKKKCAPNDLMTMCNSCHSILHRKLQRGIKKAADPKDFIIIDRPDHASYIHKKSRTVIRIRRRW